MKSIPIRFGCLYKCNMGGVWKAEGTSRGGDIGSAPARLIASWMPDVVFKRDKTQSEGCTVLNMGIVLVFGEKRRDSDPFWFISEILP